MKKIILPLFLLLFMSMVASTASAQNDAGIYFEEVFDYEAGINLISGTETSAQNEDATTGWSTRDSSKSAQTVYSISSSPLAYEGYPLSDIGNAVTCSGSDGQTVYKEFYETGTPIQVLDDTVYVAFLLNMHEGQSTEGGDFFFGIKVRTGASYYDTAARMRVIIEDDQVTYGATQWNETDISWSETTYPAGETQLVVIKYYNGPTTSDDDEDIVRVFINPDVTAEPDNSTAQMYAESVKSKDAYASASYGLCGALLRADAQVAYDMDGFRVANSYDALFSDYVAPEVDDTETDGEDTTPDVDGTVLTPTDDTYIYGSATVYGAEEVLNVYHSTAGSSYRRISYVKFDISSFASIDDVTFNLYHDAIDATGYDNDCVFAIHTVDNGSDWSETELSYSNYSVLGSNLDKGDELATSTIAIDDIVDAGYMSFSSTALTQLFQDSLAAGAQYVTLAIRNQNVVKNASSSNVIVGFHSKENASGNAPQLVINGTDEDATTPDDDEPVVDDDTTTLVEPIELTSVGDTYVYTKNSTIRGDETTMCVGYNSGGEYIRRGFVKFDISTLPASIESATLKLYSDAISGADTYGHNIQIFPVELNDWDEAVIMDANYTTYCGENITDVLASYAMATDEEIVNEYVSFSSDDLTTHVKDAIDNGDQYISFRIGEATPAEEKSTEKMYFHTKENASGNAPKLVIVESDTETGIAANDAVAAKFAVANGTLYVSQEDNAAAYQIYNIAGTLLQTGSLDAGVSSIAMPYANGLYIVKLVSNQTTYVEKVIVK